MKIYFIVMELLNNTIKHSHAKESRLSIDENKDDLFINIMDNGKGFDSNTFHTLEGFGINQIKSRINNLRGTIEINSKINIGTTIIINVPITHNKKITTPVYPSQ